MNYEHSNWHLFAANGLIRHSIMMRYCTALAAVLANVFAISGVGSAQDFMAAPGAPAAAFPKADRPVANVVNPIWHDEKERTPPVNLVSSHVCLASDPV